MTYVRSKCRPIRNLEGRMVLECGNFIFELSDSAGAKRSAHRLSSFPLARSSRHVDDLASRLLDLMLRNSSLERKVLWELLQKVCHFHLILNRCLICISIKLPFDWHQYCPRVSRSSTSLTLKQPLKPRSRSSTRVLEFVSLLRHHHFSQSHHHPNRMRRAPGR